MKKVLAVIFFSIVLFIPVRVIAVNIALIAPFSGSLSSFSNNLFNGLSVALPSYVNIIKIDSNSNFTKELKDISPVAIVGPFSKRKVDELFGKYCNKSVIVILPFAKQTGSCSNGIFYGYDPLEAAKKVADRVCKMDVSKIGVLYSFDRVDMAQKSAFDNTLLSCGRKVFLEDGIPALYNLMDDFVRELFGVVKLKNFSGLTEGNVFENSLNLDVLVVFAPQDVFVHLLNLLDYYDINIDSIISANIQIDENLLSLSNRIKRKLSIITPYFMCQNTQEGRKFLSEYRKEFYSDPSFTSALGYDIGFLLNNYFKGKDIRKIRDVNLLLGHLLFFDDSGSAVLQYRSIGYKELSRCRQEILNR